MDENSKKVPYNKAGVNHIIVKTEKTKENELSTNLLSKNGEKLTLVLDTSYQPHHHARIWANVTSVASRFSGTEIEFEYVGFPTKRGHQYKSKGLKEMPPDIEPGDKAYLHYLAFGDDNLIGKDGDYQYYFLNISQILCSVRDGDIIPIAGYVLVLPYYSEDAEDVELDDGKLKWTIKAKVSKESGIIEEIHDKPKFLEGVLHAIGDHSGFYPPSVVPGDRIYYTDNSQFENEIEGTTYYVMHQWDIFAKNNNDTPEPVANYVMIQPDIELTEIKGVYLPLNNSEIVNTGKIMSVGDTIDHVSKGDRVYFEGKSKSIIKFDDKNLWFMPEQDILYKELET